MRKIGVWWMVFWWNVYRQNDLGCFIKISIYYISFICAQPIAISFGPHCCMRCMQLVSVSPGWVAWWGWRVCTAGQGPVWVWWCHPAPAAALAPGQCPASVLGAATIRRGDVILLLTHFQTDKSDRNNEHAEEDPASTFDKMQKLSGVQMQQLTAPT